MKVLRLDTQGEKPPNLCDSAFLDSAYNWRTGGFNVWRCQKKIGHNGPHAAHIGINYHDGGMNYIRVEWTDWREQLVVGDQADVWREVDKERARC